MNIRKTFSLLLAFCAVTMACAQTAYEEIAANRKLSANNYYAYPLPTEELTPPPAGYEPFYISTYMRHGSRFLIDGNDYLFPLRTLQEADAQGKLTSLGRETMKKLDVMHRMSEGRLGELTPLGARQHRGIAERMFHNFPQVFADSALVDARSTVVIRCILSMTAECLRLQALNPRLRFRNDASYHDMYYMNAPAPHVIDSVVALPRVKETVAGFVKKHVRPSRLMSALFTDEAYVRDHVDSVRLMRRLFDVACNMQSHDTDMELYSLFTDRECYDLWRCENLSWYLGNANASLTDHLMPYREAALLRDILDKADDALKQGVPAASLRFGHESCLLPLAALLELDNCGEDYPDLETLDQHWRAYKIFPMASNIQFVFYRKAGSEDILLKVLLNEHETKLPVKAASAPYYRWEDVEAYYRKKLENFPVEGE